MIGITVQTIPNTNRFLVDQNDDGVSVGSVPIVAPFRVGRREGFDLCLSSPTVSGLHAEILEEDGELWLYDLNSTNGTYVNEERIDVKVNLRDSDSIVFGDRRFEIVMAAGESSGERGPMATVPTGVPTPALESPEQKFQRLLDSGAVPLFQPIYEISSNAQRLIGYEVLGRSRIFGLKTPEQMFAAAIPLEMESELSRVLRQRGIKAAQNQLPEDLKLFVNTHPAELERSVLIESLDELRKAYPNRPIVLELSEASLNHPTTFPVLRSVLKNLNIGLALHDFSAGKIQLAALNRIAPDIIKFDSALLQGIGNASLTQQRLVRAMVKMVKELGITPMAEYIESVEDHESLSELGFEYAQGYHYGLPVDINTVSTRCERDRQSSVAKTEVVTSARVKKETSESKLRPVDLMKKLAEQDKTTTSDSDASDSIKSFEGHRDSNWLMQQHGYHYTIQLMISSSQSSVDDFLTRQNLSGEYATYRKNRNNKDLFVVVYGVFEDRAKAKAQVESFKKQGAIPVVRRLTDIQNEIQKRLRVESASEVS